jgi:hypothetical protein
VVRKDRQQAGEDHSHPLAAFDRPTRLETGKRAETLRFRGVTALAGFRRTCVWWRRRPSQTPLLCGSLMNPSP